MVKFGILLKKIDIIVIRLFWNKIDGRKKDL